LVALTILVSLRLYRIVVEPAFSFANYLWTRIILFPVSIFILAIYPTDLLESVAGGIFTALVGMLILFISTWALATAILPRNEMGYEDILDDFAAIYREIKSRIKFIPRLENVTKIGWLQSFFSWLNPRRHKWNFIVMIALIVGGSLMVVETFHEGLSSDSNVVLLVIAVFLGIEGAGIVLGYLLFEEFLGIFRKG